MTAKEKQSIFIKTYLKPTLKNRGYQGHGQTWWKDKGIFFTLLNLQNCSWNNQDEVDFCFNIGIAIKAAMKDTNKNKPTVHDLNVYLREGFYLPEDRKENQFKNNNGYTLNSQDDIVDFISSLKKDFESYILPFLDNLITLQDCVGAFGEITFWGDNLKRIIQENQLISN